MIKIDIDKGKGNFEINGEWTNVLAEVSVACLYTLGVFSKNEVGFLEAKKQLSEMIDSLTYADWQGYE